MDPRAGEGEVFLAKIEAVVSPILEAHTLELVDLQWRREGRRWVRVVMTRTEGRDRTCVSGFRDRCPADWTTPAIF